MTRLTYYPTVDEPCPPGTYECATPHCRNTSRDKHCPECAPRIGIVRHGYTIADIDHLTRGALIADRLMAMDYEERRDIAWSAIAEYLCTAEKAPSRLELIQVGWQAIARTVRDGLRQRGYRDGTDRTDAVTMSRFAKYWSPPAGASLEDRVIECVAVTQILDTLTDANKDAITALAVADDYAKGAELLDLAQPAFNVRIATARRQLLALWHEGETPRRTGRVDRRVASHSTELATRCGNGHEWTLENTRWSQGMANGKPKKRRFCRQCERERQQGRTARRSGGEANSDG